MPETPPSLAALYRSWLPADGIAELDQIIADAKKRGVVVDHQKIASALVRKYTWHWPPLPRDCRAISAACPDDVEFALQRHTCLDNPCDPATGKAQRQAWISSCRSVAQLVATGIDVATGWHRYATWLDAFTNVLRQLPKAALDEFEQACTKAQRLGDAATDPLTVAQEIRDGYLPKPDHVLPAPAQPLPAVLTQLVEPTPGTPRDASQRPSQRPQATKSDRISPAQFLGGRLIDRSDPAPGFIGGTS